MPTLQRAGKTVSKANKLISVQLERFTERDFVWLLCTVFAITVAVAAHVGVNGSHQWRQADVLANVAGFRAPELIPPFTDFLGKKILYDIPVYQFCAAKLAKALSIDILPAIRYLNILLLAIFLPASYKLAESITAGAGKYLILLLTFSPLFLRYWSAPLPDLMSLSLGAAWLSMALAKPSSLSLIIVSGVFLSISCVIKSPVIFPLAIFYGAFVYMSGGIIALRDRKVFIYAIIAFISAIGAEITRSIFLRDQIGFGQNPLWYFGALEIRFSREFWLYFLLHPRWELFLNRHVANFMLIVTFAGIVVGFWKSVKTFHLAVACVAGALAGWLVFSNLYLIHDYYHLSSGYLLLLLAASMASMIERFVFLQQKVLFAAFISALLIASAIKAPTIGRELTVTSEFDAMSFLLRNHRLVTFVSDVVSNHDPTMGGRLRTSLNPIPKEALEKDCQLTTSHPVLIVGETSCHDLMAEKFDLVYRYPPYRLYLPRR
ncbi:MAG: hypothetical protein ACK4MV_05630 [Beijerinckiaceae bacterium]